MGLSHTEEQTTSRTEPRRDVRPRRIGIVRRATRPRPPAAARILRARALSVVPPQRHRQSMRRPRIGVAQG